MKIGLVGKSRYINANKLIERLMHNPNFLTAPKHSKDGIIDEIVYQPTADVAPIVHGEWETIPDYKPNTLTAYNHICSVCKTTYKDVRPYGHKYCHECGAKMDGKRSENGT